MQEKDPHQITSNNIGNAKQRQAKQATPARQTTSSMTSNASKRKQRQARQATPAKATNAKQVHSKIIKTPPKIHQKTDLCTPKRSKLHTISIQNPCKIGPWASLERGFEKVSKISDLWEAPVYRFGTLFCSKTDNKFIQKSLKF